MYEKNFIIYFYFNSYVFIVDAEKVYAAERNEQICIELSGNDDFESAKQVVKTDIVYETLERGTRSVNGYTPESYEKTIYMNKYTEEGFRVTLCAIKLEGIAYFYDDGKVHLYSIRATSCVYVDDFELELMTPSLNNTDGSVSEGNVVGIITSSDYGLITVRAWVRLTYGSTNVSCGLDTL